MHARIAVVASLLTACAAPTSYTAHRATEHVYWAGNLHETAPLAATPWDPAAPFIASAASTTVLVYDALGTPHDLSLYFVHTQRPVWEVHLVVDGSELEAPTVGPVEVGSGVALCDAGVAQPAVPLVAEMTFDGAPPQSVDFSFETPAGAPDRVRVTCTSGPSSVSALEQDGF
jgi:hypothetical protein